MKILIAEDDLANQGIAKLMMTMWGLEFDMVSNGMEAVEQVQRNDGHYDLCLMDIDMPVMDGFEATRSIRQKAKYFPIMALSGNPAIKDKYLDVGMDDFLEKPYSPSHLLHKINKLTIKLKKLYFDKNNLCLERETPMNQKELQELIELKKKGLTKIKLVGTDHIFVVHRNIQNKISHDLVGEGKDLSVFIDRSEDEPGRCHLYKANLHVTKDLLTQDELQSAVQEEDEIAMKFNLVADKRTKGED